MSNKKSNVWIWVVIIIAIILVFAWLRSSEESDEKEVVDEDFERRMQLLQQKEELETEKEILNKHNQKIGLIQAVLKEFADKTYKRIMFALGIVFVVWNIVMYFAFSGYSFGWVVELNAFVVLLLVGIEFAIYRKVKGFQKRIKTEVKKYVYVKYFEHRTPEFFANKKEMNWNRMQEIEREILEIDEELNGNLIL